jgi:hypothetical protein
LAIAFGVGSIFTDRIQIFLPSKVVIVSAIVAKVSGVISSVLAREQQSVVPQFQPTTQFSPILQPQKWERLRTSHQLLASKL